jgi:preprotein translocase subunit SecE
MDMKKELVALAILVIGVVIGLSVFYGFGLDGQIMKLRASSSSS